MLFTCGVREDSYDCKEIQPVILKEISPGCSLEGQMVKQKLQYFGHLMRRAASFEKTLMLGKLPRVSRLLFVKLMDTETGKLHIYIKPYYGGVITGTKKSNAVAQQQLKEERGDSARKGQEKYREQVFHRYPSCVVTHVTDPNLLTACHIKGYAQCNQAEQYDKFNGLTMTPTIHKLFDLGYLTFDKTGRMILSDFFRNNDRRCLDLMRVKSIKLDKEMLPYLDWHNEHTFIRTSRGVQIVSQE